MLFSGLSFLYYFLPGALIIYYAAPRRFKNAVLLACSLFFYAWGGVSFAVLMAVMIAFGYVCGLALERYRDTPKERWILGAALGVNILVLVHFKFAKVFPVGISFYTFQLMSYQIDVYRGDTKAQKNPVTLAAYASMFPQLVAGPIVRYSDVERELRQRSHSFPQIWSGVQRFVTGLAKKVLIANVLGEFCDLFRASQDPSVLFYWLYAAAFTLHIYFDFSGYSDMAIGLGRLFGFEFPENFRYPYISGSITEFWRRWHISLGSWFRDYVYIPLGGNRVSRGRWLFNILVVWFLTGFWHGASWNFVVWGLLFAVILAAEKLWTLKYLEQTKILRHVYVIAIVMMSFVLFNAESFGTAISDIGAMFGAGELPLCSPETLYYLKSYGIVFLMAASGATPFWTWLVAGIRKIRFGETIVGAAELFALAGLLLLCTAYLVDGSFNPFLYFRF